MKIRSHQQFNKELSPKSHRIKREIHRIIFGADTPSGRLFDILLFVAIVISVIALMLESVKEIDQAYHRELKVLEWCLTIMFTIEYILRVYSTQVPKKYIFSFYGIVDFLAIIPTYAAIFITGAQSLMIFRAVRLLRVFRVLKLIQFVGEANLITKAVKGSMNKIIVFLMFVIIVCTVLGTLMYLIEGSEAGFTSIPRGIYWAVVTLTTVGYGDVSPTTPMGQLFAMILMIMGYGVIAVPTGLVTAGIVENVNKDKWADLARGASTRSCQNCSTEGHLDSANYCRECGAMLPPKKGRLYTHD